MNHKQTYQLLFMVLLCLSMTGIVAQSKDPYPSTRMYGDVTITLDQPTTLNPKKPVTFILFALPNGNNTAWTMGKKMHSEDNWHYDIQHIKAQTAFIRAANKKNQLIVAYLENDQKSWSAWKTKHPDYLNLVSHLVDSMGSIYAKTNIHLNGHSGGGSFIFAYLASVKEIPDQIKRISFLDSDYNYDSTYLEKLSTWLENKQHQLRVFAYNDSVALYNGKPVVSPTGGTWYRSQKMLQHLSQQFSFKDLSNDSMHIYKSKSNQIQFFLKTNPARIILHTKQVELNGFIHSELSGTRKDSKHYRYFGKRAYEAYIED